MQTLKRINKGVEQYKSIAKQNDGYAVQTIVFFSENNVELKTGTTLDIIVNHEFTGFSPCSEPEFFAARKRAYQALERNEIPTPQQTKEYYLINTLELVTA